MNRGTFAPDATLPASNHLDLIERRMLGLLSLLEKTDAPKAATYRASIAKIAQSSFDRMVERAQPLMGDISFEAEAFYGSEPERWLIHMDELVSNFEEDIVNKELVSTMNELRAAERAHDGPRVAELAQRCQALSVRKAGAGKRKKA